MDNFSDSIIQNKHATYSEKGIVSSQHKKASKVGADILAVGGNAIDAAIATSFALGVLEPWMSGPAGGGSMLVWLQKEQKCEVIHYGMRSSKNLNIEDFYIAGTGVSNDLFPWPRVINDNNVSGAKSVAVPGTVAGMGLAHKKYASMSWQDLISPAINLCREGLLVDWYAALIIASCTKELAKFPSSAEIWLEDNQWPTIAGWTAISEKKIVNKKFANTLEYLAKMGWQDFYQGDIAQSLSKDIVDAGGSVNIEDLKSYQAEVFKPLNISYQNAEIWAAPFMSAGPTLAKSFQILKQLNRNHVASKSAKPSSDMYINYVKSIQQAYAHRLETMGDDGSNNNYPTCTTHFCVVDKQGNIVSNTQTLLSIFGSKFTSKETGLLLNNGVMWFDPEQGKPNSLAANKRCLMNVCPVIGKNEDFTFGLGASGGRKIMPAVLQLISFMVDYKMTLNDAFHCQRIDASKIDKVILDSSLDDKICADIAKVFDVIKTKRTVFPYAFACPSAVATNGKRNIGITEIMSPWGDSVAEI